MLCASQSWNRSQKAVGAAALALLMLVLVCANDLHAQASSPEELILRTQLALDLSNAALEDAVEPIGGLLGRISPSSSYATANRGFGYGAISFGATGLKFDITSPDYTAVDANGNPDQIEGPAGAFFADAEIGLFAGFGRERRVNNVGSVDLLLRFGATLGDQRNLAEDLKLDSWKPIYGAGLRIGVLRGEGLPALSLSFGFNHLVRRSFNVLGQVDNRDFEVDLDLKQTSSFFLLEIGKQWGMLLPYGGIGFVHHRLEADYSAEVVVSANSATTISQGLGFENDQVNLFGGVELGSGFVRLVLEAGTVADSPFGTVFFKFIPFPGYSR